MKTCIATVLWVVCGVVTWAAIMIYYNSPVRVFDIFGLFCLAVFGPVGTFIVVPELILLTLLFGH